MDKYVAKRIRFQNGERVSVLKGPNGLPVHEVTLHLDKYRKRGRAANTIHHACTALALLYRELSKARIDLLPRLRKGQFLTVPEVSRLADAAQYHASDLEEQESDSGGANVISLKRIRTPRKATTTTRAVEPGTQASRIRYMASHLEYLAGYFRTSLPPAQAAEFASQSTVALKALREHIPLVSKRAKLNGRQGLSEEDQARVLEVVHPASPNNPWKDEFVKLRNWLIVVLMLALGVRRGELLGIQISDLRSHVPRILILRRADTEKDTRRIQELTKTRGREVELRPAIMKAVWNYVDKRPRIKGTKKRSIHLIVGDHGEALSSKSIDAIFADIRAACPGLPVHLVSHVMRHTWNERFSEQAERMGLSDAVEQKARNEQQGWTDDSEMAVNYTRRHTSKKGRALSLKLQEKLDGTES